MHTQTVFSFSCLDVYCCSVGFSVQRAIDWTQFPVMALVSESGEVAVNTNTIVLCLTVWKCKCVFKEKLPLQIRLRIHSCPEKLRRIQLNTSTWIRVSAWMHMCPCALSGGNSEIHLKSYTIDVKGKVRAKPNASAVCEAVTLWKEADQHSR